MSARRATLLVLVLLVVVEHCGFGDGLHRRHPLPDGYGEVGLPKRFLGDDHHPYARVIAGRRHRYALECGHRYSRRGTSVTPVRPVVVVIVVVVIARAFALVLLVCLVAHSHSTLIARLVGWLVGFPFCQFVA